MAEGELIRGNVDTVILKVLFDGDRYGYDMIKQINARSGGQWELKQPTLYACLKRLEKQGFITSYWDESDSNGGRRKYYSLTDSGREVFVSYKNEWERSRDLFGELITGNDTMLTADSFDDVEDDEYAVPKRRVSRAKRPRPSPATETAQPEPEPISEPEVEPEHVEQVEQVEAFTQPEPQSEVEYIPPADDGEYVQQSMFDMSDGDYAATDGALDDEPVDEAAPSEQAGEAEQVTVEETAQQVETEEPVSYEARPAADPHSIIEELYATTYTGNRSYADARTLYEEHDAPAKPAQPVQQVQPSPVAQPTPTQPADAVQTRREESLARREYKDILGDLVSSCEAKTVADREQAAAAAARAASGNKFDSVKQAISELGNEVTVRSHNDSAKQYTHKYYYYSNKLMMTHYTAMCSVMFVFGLILFLILYAGAGIRMRFDGLFYTFMGLLPIIMFIVAVIMFAYDPDKKKRINVNFRFSIIIRTVIMLQVWVLIYCFNLIWGMPVGFATNYVPSIVIPAVYAMFIPLSEVIFMTLLKTGQYAVE